MENVQVKEAEQDTSTTSLLNQFILGQLKEKNGSNGEITTRNGFVLPKLQLGNQTVTGTKFMIPPLKLQSTNLSNVSNNSISTTANAPVAPLLTRDTTLSDNIARLSSSVQRLQVNEQSNTITPAIDLTTALSCATGGLNGLVRSQRTTKQTTVEDFEIPFIECDRQQKPILWSNSAKTDCQLDTCVRTLLSNRKSLADPSPCGRIICLSYKRMRPLPYVTHNFKVQHKIQRFRFDTQSPDDIVVAAMSKYHRQH